jgi:aquaporin Z
MTALAFGLVLLALVYGIGPISGCHVNPAVTIGFLAAGRISITDAIGYWVAQIVGGIAGAAGLYGIVHSSHLYHSGIGLGADGYGKSSMIGANAAGAFAAEIVLTFIFVFVILVVTRRASNATVAGVVIGFSLTLVHLIGIPIDGTSVNPARSLGPALFIGGSALSQLWVFLIAPLLGGRSLRSRTGTSIQRVKRRRSSNRRPRSRLRNGLARCGAPLSSVVVVRNSLTRGCQRRLSFQAACRLA